MCPGMRPATGWMPNTTSTPRLAQDLGELGRGVVRAGDREPVAGHDHDPLRVVEQDRDVVGLHRAHRPIAAPPPAAPPATCARNAPKTMPGDGAAHGLRHRHREDRSARADERAGDQQQHVREDETGCRDRESGEGVEQRDHDRHVGAADREHEQHAEDEAGAQRGGRRTARRRSRRARPRRRRAASTSSTMSTRSPGKVTARVVMMPCSLPNVTNDPVSETAPISTVTATTPRVHGLSLCPTSTSATSAAAPPPTPLKAATSCGICVICTRRAAITAITAPTAIAATIQTEVAQLDAQHVGERPRSPPRRRRAGSPGARCAGC